jgi:hypothetical protein
MSRETSRSYAQPHRPVAIAAANRLGRLLARAGLEARLDEASLVAAARRRTRLHFFGDEAFRLPLRRLLAAIGSEARLHPVGRFMIRQVLLGALTGRLRIAALRERHPEIAEEPVRAPVFIVGLQRTGTTLLQRLLALHPDLRALSSWEAVNPAPFLERRPRPGRPDPRIAQAELAERAARYMAPDFFAIHPIVARGQEEDSLVFDPSFHTTTAEALMNVPSFTAWLESVDHRGAYREYRAAIQLLLWQRPGPGRGGSVRWLGKTPLHLEHLDVLLETFPDAKIVHTHRDPSRTLASLCSMLAHGRGFFSDCVDPREIGRQWLAKTRRMVELGTAARDRVGEAPFVDVQYHDLCLDPLKQVQRICDGVGAPLPAATEAVMRGFLAAHPQHEHGVHAYALADFGLSEAEVERAFSAYRERHAVEPE